MIDKLWFGRHPLYFLLWPLLWPLSRLFYLISTRRRHAFLSGKKARYRAPLPVIVVGNITAGGNGKTPVVVWLVELLQRQGYRPGVVSRGYGGKAAQYPLLVTDHTLPTECGDEPKLIYQRTGAPVAVDPIRAHAVQALLSQGVDLIVTDDGLQHYALERDIEFAVVDGVRRFGNQQLLPLGPLREPVERLQQVDFVINNGGEPVMGELAMTLKPSLAVNVISGERIDVAALSRLVAWAGIGHPARFFNTLHQLGASLILTHDFADHQAFDETTLRELASQGDNVIMTEKDAVKCTDFAAKNWWYLPVSAEISPTDQQCILDKIKEVMEHYGPPSA